MNKKLIEFIVYKGTWEPISNLFESDANTSSGVSLMLNEFEKNCEKTKKEKKKENLYKSIKPPKKIQKKQ